ncbi:histidine phosphatase family protein [Nocardiopsis ansamitocini]|uniref:Phosphoglycerate mutase n=1 Tax=Nocardiopsis ansamitocini TaxID=1670832 RepID=A0A9W6P6L5_9ACTN|nr:histidine phosphatase family protein [Nocardiopsis ansamitocini]GLU47998.1 phosphoglycerate mutase [Nocardiopsis ansamitocini]
MTQTRRIICWRHGQTDWNVESRFQGQTDIPLNEQGVAQAERAASLLATLQPDAIIASDLQRAADTGAALARLTGLTVEHDPGLRERFGGPWEGLTRDEISANWPEQHRRMDIPGGESMPDVGARVAEVIVRGLEKVPDNGLLVVASHGAALRAGIHTMLGLPEDQLEALGSLSNCAWSVLGPRRLGGWRLLEHNAGTLPEGTVLGDDG